MQVVLSLALTPVIWAILAFGVWELLVADVLEGPSVDVRSCSVDAVSVAARWTARILTVS